MFDVDAVRSCFPALKQNWNGKTPVFLDNPGGTQVPRSVIDAMNDCLIRANANLGGAFRSSRAADALVWAAHEAMADFVNAASPREIVFGANMTTLTLHLSRSLARRLKPGDEILLTRMDHDANVEPWLLLARDLDLTVRYLPFDVETYEFDLAQLDPLLNERTALVCVGYASNLTGTINDVAAIAERARAVGALTYVDAVQYAPHGVVDVQALGCDFLVCSAYKFFGPHVGILWAREALLAELEPYKVRAAGDDPPHNFETGTLNHEGLAGTTAAIDYFARIGREMGQDFTLGLDPKLEGRRRDLCAGMAALLAHELPLMRRLIEGLETMEGVTVHGITNPNAFERRVPTVSLSVEGRKPRDLAESLAAEEIYVWDGHNYALEPVRLLGLEDKGGVLRIGLAHYNTIGEVEACLAALRGALGQA